MIVIAMFKGKAKGSGLNSNSRGNLEDRLETNTFFTDKSTVCVLGAPAELTDSSDIVFSETIFIGVNDDLIWGDYKYE